MSKNDNLKNVNYFPFLDCNRIDLMLQRYEMGLISGSDVEYLKSVVSAK